MTLRLRAFQPLLRPRNLSASLFAQRYRSTRLNSSYQPPTQPEASNAHRNFWKSFGRPIAKVFLGALCTYQLLYWSWLKLESVEYQSKSVDEIKMLEAQLESLRKDTKRVQ